MKALYEEMSDASLEAEIERLTHEIACYEALYEAEDQTTNYNERVLNQGAIDSNLQECFASKQRALKERSCRMGFWVAP